MLTLKAEMADEDDLLCHYCLHNLRGVPSSVCPECGRAFDRSLTLASTIPWQQRRSLGWVRGYLQTVYITLRQPARLEGFAAGPLSFAATRSFLRVNALVATVLFAGGLVALAFVSRKIHHYGFTSLANAQSTMATFLASGWFIGINTVAAYFWLLGVTALPALFFRASRLPVERRAPLAAAAAYLMAPFAFIAVLGLFTCLGLLPEAATSPDPDLRYYPSLLPHVMLLFVLPAGWLLTSVGRLRRLTGCSRVRQTVYVMGVPLLIGVWTVAAFLTANLLSTLLVLFWRAVTVR